MDVPASPAELPALRECLGAFQVRFRRPEGRQALERDTTGLRTELPNKNGDTMAQAVPGTSAQRLPACLTTMPGDAEDVNRQRVQKMMAEASRGDGVWGFDETGFRKPGTASVGVERQDSGTLGQVGHGPVAVTGGDTDPPATWPVAVRLSVPKTWAYDPARRQPARVPPEVAFQTNPESALVLLDQARAWGGPHRGVVADADDGDHPHLLAGLEARQAPSVVAGRTDVAVRLRHVATSRLGRADALRQTVPRWPGRPMRWRQGTTGWRRQQFVAVRCWRLTNDGHRHEGWRGGERARRGQPEARQYGWSHLFLDTPLDALAGLAHRRHAMDQFHEEAQGELGWDQDQGRLWPGFHRHAITVMLAYSFLVWLERRQRHRVKSQRRPGGPCSPSAAVPAPDAAGRAA